MSFAVGFYKQPCYQEKDPTSLDTVLEALRGTSKGRLPYPEPLYPPSVSNICDVKYVGDLDHIINSYDFKNEISFSDNYSPSFSVPILNVEEDAASFQSVANDHIEVQSLVDCQGKQSRENGWNVYRARETSPDRSPTKLDYQASGVEEEDSLDGLFNASEEKEAKIEELQHNLEKMLALMQVDTTATAATDRVKRNQALYVAQVAAIRKNAAAELQRRQEKLKREEEIEKLQQQEEWRQIVEAIELNSLTLLAAKRAEAEQRKAELFAQLSEAAAEAEQKQKILEEQQLCKKQQEREGLMSDLKETFSEFSSALDQMLKEIKQCGDVALPAETDAELNRTLQEGSDLLASEATVDAIQDTAQKINHSLSVVHRIRGIIDARKQSVEATSKTAEDTSNGSNLAQSTTTESLASAHPYAESALQEAKDFFEKLSAMHGSVSQVANLLTSTDMSMRSQISRSLTSVNQFNNDTATNRQKLHQLINLLTGSTCSAGGAQVAIADQNSPAAMFAREQLARKLISLAHDKQVSSQHVYASLMLRLFKVDALLYQVCLYHLFKTCPYLIPNVYIREQFASEEEFHRSLGYRQKDGGEREKLDGYLKRMNAAGQLFGRLVSVEVEDSKMSLSLGWQWLGRIFLVPVQSAVTASVLHGFLSTAGNKMASVYGRQFQKLMFLLKNEFLPLISKATGEGGEADLASLYSLIEKYFQTGSIPQPVEGYKPLL